MRLTLRQLQLFTAIADTGSTAAAGLRAALSQSAASGALGELERLLGLRLFDRIGKRLLLNDNGRALLPEARALLDAAQAIEDRCGVGRADAAAAVLPTRLRIGASTTIGNYLLPGLVAGYRAAWPGTAVDAVIGNTEAVARSVARLEVDLGLIEGPCPEAALEVAPWRTDALVVVAAPAHPLAKPRRAPLPLAALREAEWLLREPGSGTREAVEQALLPHLHRLRAGMLAGSTEAIKQAAAAGLGLACLPSCAVEDLVTLGRLAELRTALPPLARRLYRVHHPQKRFSGNLARFVAHCAPAAASRRAA
jgi:DNA-binding transcriptional LysR family regulator